MVELSQLRALGITRGSYEHRVRTGALHRVFPSVLCVVDPVLEPLAYETAALLYVGDDAVLSHDSAAALWGLTTSPSFVAITVIGRRVRSRPGVRVHQVKGLDIRDLRHHQGFPVTSPARTLIDCATSPTIDRLLNEARVLKLVKDAEIYAAMERSPGRTGADAYWSRVKLIIEVDGYQAHGHWAAFQRDRARDRRLIAAGFVVLRFTWHQLIQRPLEVVAEIARTLGRLEADAA
jgi:Protein of unknown function (DUF559)